MQTHAARSPWIVDPWTDLLLICGGGVWIFAGLFSLLSDSLKTPAVALALSVIFFVLEYVSANPHTAATYVRLYHSKESRKKYSLYSELLVLPFLVLAVIGFYTPGMGGAMLKLYALWVVQHYSAQSYGIAMIYCIRGGYQLSGALKRVMSASFALMAFAQIARALTFVQDPLPAGLITQPVWGPIPIGFYYALQALLTICLGLFAFMVFDKWQRDKQILPFPALAIMVSLFFFVSYDWNYNNTLWLFIPGLYHGSQYILLSSVFHFREKGLTPAPQSHWSRFATAAGVKYVLAVVGGGILLYKISPYLVSLLGVDRDVAFASIFGAANFHHFITDRAIWRLRQPAVRQVIAEVPSPAVEARPLSSILRAPTKSAEGKARPHLDRAECFSSHRP